MKFKLLSGSFSGKGRKPITFKAGDVIESDKDLVTAFPNKFQRVSDSAKASEGVTAQRIVRAKQAPQEEQLAHDDTDTGTESDVKFKKTSEDDEPILEHKGHTRKATTHVAGKKWAKE